MNKRIKRQSVPSKTKAPKTGPANLKEQSDVTKAKKRDPNIPVLTISIPKIVQHIQRQKKKLIAVWNNSLEGLKKFYR